MAAAVLELTQRICLRGAERCEMINRGRVSSLDRNAPGNLCIPEFSGRNLGSPKLHIQRHGSYSPMFKRYEVSSPKFDELAEFCQDSNLGFCIHDCKKSGNRHSICKGNNSSIKRGKETSRNEEIDSILQSWHDLEHGGKEHARTASRTSSEFLTCTTFNILAPIYKRLHKDIRESEFKELWMTRNNDIANILAECASSIICLQEFWLDNPELVGLYAEKLEKENYELHTLARTNNRGDGLLTAIKSDRLKVVDYQKLLFHDCGDRVAQVMRLRVLESDLEGVQHAGGEVLLVNTHLLFPHSSNSCSVRLRQVHKILDYLGEYTKRNNLPPMPIILCGDWNGSKRGQVYKFLRSQGFVSGYDTAHEYTDTDHAKWVSHRNHRGNICGVDFIWLLNPQAEEEETLNVDWKAAVFKTIKEKLDEEGLEKEAAFEYFQTAKDHEGYVTLQEFQHAMDQLGLTGDDSLCLTRQEICQLVQSADTNGNGVIDYSEFKDMFGEETLDEAYQRLCVPKGIVEIPWLQAKLRESLACLESGNSSTSDCLGGLAVANGVQCRDSLERISRAMRETELTEKNLRSLLRAEVSGMKEVNAESKTLKLNVKDAFLYPPEVETGVWPENYSLSDHAPLTVIFSPGPSASKEQE